MLFELRRRGGTKDHEFLRPCNSVLSCVSAVDQFKLMRALEIRFVLLSSWDYAKG